MNGKAIIWMKQQAHYRKEHSPASSNLQKGFLNFKTRYLFFGILALLDSEHIAR
jgi:hypothetical protein